MQTHTALVDILEFSKLDVPFTRQPKTARRAPRHFVTYMLCSDRPLIQVDLGPAQPIRAAINGWRTMVSGESDANNTPQQEFQYGATA